MGMRRMGAWVGILLALSYLTARGGMSSRLPERPPGRHFPLAAGDHEGASSFAAGEPMVGASYFYWYDIESKSHIIDGDGSDALTTHPADMNGISYKRASWHEQQLRDMVDAGIDFLMPVYWGISGDYDGWSFAGLPPLVAAHSLLEREGVKAPAIGLFYDTSILQWNSFAEGGGSYHVDMATDFGRQWFYTAMRDFFSMIPPEKWARVDGRPIVFLYAAAFAKNQDPSQLEYVRERFAGDFGVRPFIVKAADWKGEGDAVYSWGGAVSGPLIYRQAAALGPGYDHSAVPGRQPLVVERRDGRTYIERWLKLLQLNPRNRPWMVHVETWNEWHEGTDVADSREYGRSYIVLTRLFADMWHARSGLRLGLTYAGAKAVSWAVGSSARGLEIRPSGGDGVWSRDRVSGVEAVVSAANPHSENVRYLYFNIDDAFAYDIFGGAVTVEIRYRDGGCSSLGVEYDSAETSEGPGEGAFRSGGAVGVTGTGGWKTASFKLENCRFMNRANGADFRVVVAGGDLELAIGSVIVAKGG